MHLTPQKALSMAAKVATESSTMRYKLGSVLYDRSQYCVGYNRLFDGVKINRSTPYSVHAEEMAIIRGNRIGIDFSNAILVVARINKQGALMLARPCESCTRLINKMGIKKVYYSEGIQNF